MWKEWKKGFQLMKYSYNFKMNIGLGIFFLVIGIVMSLLGVNSFLFGAVYFYLGTIMVLQLSYSLLFSQMVIASPKRWFIDIDFADFFSIASAVCSYLFFSVFVAIRTYLSPEEKGEYCGMLIVLGVLMVVCMIYYSVCYKTFVVASVIFAICFALSYAIGMSFARRGSTLSLPVSIIIGLAIVFCGGLIANLIRKCYYRKPISALAMGAVLRKAMK